MMRSVTLCQQVVIFDVPSVRPEANLPVLRWRILSLMASDKVSGKGHTRDRRDGSC